VAPYVRVPYEVSRGGGKFNMFLSISRLFAGWRGPKSIAKLDGVYGRISPLDPPLLLMS